MSRGRARVGSMMGENPGPEFPPGRRAEGAVDMNEAAGREQKVELSVAIPVFNEVDVLPELYSRLVSVLEGTGKSFEIILVDDGSSDMGWAVIEELHAKDARVKGVRLSRNFGQHIAITAGIDSARGDAVILMDADLQDRPEEIPRLLDKLAEGYDLVYGVRKNRQDRFMKRATSAFFWKMIRRLSGIDIPENQAMLRIMSRKFVDDFRLLRERNRFLGGLFSWLGHSQLGVEVEHGQRFKGATKYNLYRMLKLTFHAVTSFSHFPLQVAGMTGLAISSVSFFFVIWFLVRKLVFGISVVGWASTMVAILFLGGVQLAVLGLIGEYLGRVFTEVQKRPIYLVRQYLD